MQKKYVNKDFFVGIYNSENGNNLNPSQRGGLIRTVVHPYGRFLRDYLKPLSHGLWIWENSNVKLN